VAVVSPRHRPRPVSAPEFSLHPRGVDDNLSRQELEKIAMTESSHEELVAFWNDEHSTWGQLRRLNGHLAMIAIAAYGALQSSNPVSRAGWIVVAALLLAGGLCRLASKCLSARRIVR
jgi:hypothetical protein